MSSNHAWRRYSITVAGRKTGISLEPQFWAALAEIATWRGTSATALVTNVDADRGNANLCSAIRVFVLRYYQDRISANPYGMSGGNP
jgi:predicted DNA-binding ribbon-helix-helix protein